MRRHRVKSGMTGWAQVNGWRGNTSIEKRIEYDLYYIENWSLPPRPQDPAPDAVPRVRPEARLLTPFGSHGETCLEHSSPAPPASSGRTSSEYLLGKGFSVIGMDNLAHGRRREHRAPGRPRVRLRQARRHELHRGRRPARLHLPLRRARPRRSTTSSCRSRRSRSAASARTMPGPRQGQGRAVPARLDVRDLRRPARASAARGLLGQRQPDRPARRLRRGQALRRGDHDGLPPRPRHPDAHRAHLQHLRPAHAPRGRPRRSRRSSARRCATRT